MKTGFSNFAVPPWGEAGGIKRELSLPPQQAQVLPADFFKGRADKFRKEGFDSGFQDAFHLALFQFAPVGVNEAKPEPQELVLAPVDTPPAFLRLFFGDRHQALN